MIEKLSDFLHSCTAISTEAANELLSTVAAGRAIDLPRVSTARTAASSGNGLYARSLAMRGELERELRAAGLLITEPETDTTRTEATGTKPAADGWADAFARTAARLPGEQPQAAAPSSMRAAMDEAVARLTGKYACGGN